MKNLKHKGCLIFIFCIFFLLNACETQEMYNTESKSKPISKYISFNEFSKHNTAKNKYLEIEQKSRSLDNSKLIYSAEYNFMIDTDQIFFWQYDNYRAYTFKVYRPDEFDKVENLIIVEKGQSIEAYLSKYTLTVEEQKQILENQVVDLTGKTEVTSLDKMYGGCWHVTNIEGLAGEDGFIYAQVVHYHNSCTGENMTRTISMALSDGTNPGGGSSGGDSSGGDSSGGSFGGFFGGGWFSGWGDGPTGPPIQIGGDSDGSSGNNSGSNGDTQYSGDNSNPYDDINTSMLDSSYIVTFPLLNSVKKYISDLDSQELDYLAQNVINAREMLLYLEEDNSQERVDYVLEFIAQDIDTPFQLDFSISEASPLFIDVTSVLGNSSEEVKFREIYDTLTETQEFRELFVNIFGTTTLANAKFVISDIPQTGSGYTRGLCSLYAIPNNAITNCVITIDRQTLLTESNATIAMVILHECVHAFLNFKLRNPNIGMPISIINGMTFQQCVNTYYNGFSGNQSQHSFFVDAMIPTMVSIMEDIKDSVVTPEQANQLVYPVNGGAFVYQPMGNPPSISDVQIPWNWTDYWTHLSYEGLQNSSSYPAIYPPNSYVDFVRFQYISAGNVILKP